MSKLTVIRHAQASIHKDDYDQLSDLGIQQAKILAQHIVDHQIYFDKIYLGTLKRHQQTAHEIQSAYKEKGIVGKEEKTALLNEHQSPRVVRFILQKVLNNESFAQLKQYKEKIKKAKGDNPKSKYLALFDEVSIAWAKGEIDTKGLDVEDFFTFKNRVEKITDHILEQTKGSEHIAIVSSGGPTAVIVGKALGLSNEKIMELNTIILNSAITTFHFKKDRFSLHQFNTTPHLKQAEMLTYV